MLIGGGNPIIYIENYKADLGKNMDKFINDKSDFNNTHIIKYNIQPISNITEEECFISSMTTIGFRNDQDESRCYVNSSLQVLFFNIFFRTLIMNIDCERMLKIWTTSQMIIMVTYRKLLYCKSSNNFF